MPRDFAWLLETLSNPQTLFPGLNSEDEQVLKDLGARWTGFVEQGKFKLQEVDKTEGDFWVRGEEYQVMPEVAPKLAETLRGSRLVVFKGDLKCVLVTFDLSRFSVLTPPPPPPPCPAIASSRPTQSGQQRSRSTRSSDRSTVSSPSSPCEPTRLRSCASPLHPASLVLRWLDLLTDRSCALGGDSVGLDEGVEERVEKEDPKWRVNGKWAVVSFAPTK